MFQQLLDLGLRQVAGGSVRDVANIGALGAANAPDSAAPPGERRRHERLQLFVNLRVKRTGESGVMEEQTVTENVSRGGARVYTTLPVKKGESLSVTDLDNAVAAEAVVRNVYVGSDRVTRLNLQFPDARAFERLLLAAGTPPLPPEETP